MARSAVLGLLLILAACTNGYQQFYRDYTSGNMAPYEPFTGEPRLSSASADPNRDILNMFEDGYWLIGVSSFVGPAETREGAAAQAKKVGAAVVLFTRKYQSTASGAIPFTTPTTTTSYSSGTVNSFSGRGMGSYSGTTTTFGSETTYVPYSVDRYNQSALYFARMKPTGMGLKLDRLSDDQRQRAGTNQGVAVTAVRRGSPAFKSDILPGDIMLAIDDRPTFDPPSLREAISKATGQEATLTLFRGSQRISKTILIPRDEW